MKSASMLLVNQRRANCRKPKLFGNRLKSLAKTRTTSITKVMDFHHKSDNAYRKIPINIIKVMIPSGTAKLYIPAVNNYLPQVNTMVSITENESRTVEFLTRNFSKNYNINRLAKELGISPGGMYKILKKLEKLGLLIENKLGNNSFYKINFASQDAVDACRFALTGKNLSPYARVWAKDLEALKEKTYLAVLFGSLLTKDKEARDVDVLLVFGKKNFGAVNGLIEKINRLKPKKIHAVYQTKEDFLKNLKNSDPAILEEVRTGVILWGRDFLVEAIKNEQA